MNYIIDMLSPRWRWFVLAKRTMNLGRVVAELDPKLVSGVADKTINPKRLSTRRNLGMTRLPAILHIAAELKIKQIASKFFRREARYLQMVLDKIKLPDDELTEKAKRKDIKADMIVRNKVPSSSDYDPSEYRLNEEEVIARDELRLLIEGKLGDKIRHWHYYDYDEFASTLYMGVRLAPNYACLKSVLDEIHDLHPDYRPQSVLDFGSGMGTTTWAVNETWPNEVKEFLNVDISEEQKQLCEFLLRGGKEFGEPISNLYHRHYLPTSTRERYDMVVSAFSLMELPTVQMRSQILETLWQKTNDLLVIVERGNHEGFTAVNEARQFILDLTGHGTTKRLQFHPETKPRHNVNLPDSHVIAPCCHEFSCPRVTFSAKMNLNTCAFQVAYEPLNLGATKGSYSRERFSYVVIRRGPHPSYRSHNTTPRWPRVIAPPRKRGGQVIHKLCCPDGNIGEIVVSKARYGKPLFDVAKSVKLGDVLPVKITDNYVKNTDRLLLAQEENRDYNVNEDHHHDKCE